MWKIQVAPLPFSLFWMLLSCLVKQTFHFKIKVFFTI